MEVNGDTFIWDGEIKEYRLLERSQASPARPSDRSIMKTKMCEEGVWEVTVVPRNEGRENLLSH